VLAVAVSLGWTKLFPEIVRTRSFPKTS
jgi:hypothetical protein